MHYKKYTHILNNGTSKFNKQLEQNFQICIIIKAENEISKLSVELAHTNVYCISVTVKSVF